MQITELLQRIEAIERIVAIQASIIEAQASTIAAQAQEIFELKAIIAERDAEIVRLNAIIVFQNEKIAKLEARLKTNSSNSSKPPSSDPPWKKKLAIASNGKRGGQNGHEGVTRELVEIENVDVVVVCKPADFCGCGGSVSLDESAPEKKQVFEIPQIKAHVTEYQIFNGTCTVCSKNVRGALPSDAPAGMLGPNALATIGLLTGRYHLSKRDVKEYLSDYFGLTICTATVCNAEQQISSALLQPYNDLAAAIKKEAVVACDETSHKILGKLGWMWVALCSMSAVFFARANRNTEVAQEILGKDFSGILISDRFGAYNWVSNRQVCWAHLIRDFNKLADVGGESARFACPILIHIQKMFSIWHRFRDGEINRSELKSHMIPICTKIENDLEKGQTVPGAQGLCKNLCKIKSSLWTFIHHDGVEPTNNDAERTVRQYVIWRKTSFGTQGENGNQFVERILTTVGTCKRQKRSVYEYLSTLMSAKLLGLPAPSLLQNAAT